MPLSSLRTPFEYWPYGYVTETKEGLADCANKIITRIAETLLPYFDKYNNYVTAHQEKLPEIDAFNGAITDAVFIALKAGDRKAAIKGLEGMLNQRETARKEKARNYPEEIEKKTTGT